jgi:hypothetical protein
MDGWIHGVLHVVNVFSSEDDDEDGRQLQIS